MAEIKHCPSCGKEAVPGKDGKIICLACNITYKIEEDGAAKAIDLDPMEKITKNILAEVDKKLSAGTQPNPEIDPAIADIIPDADGELPEDEGGFIKL